jgi:hypothetical protein
MITNAKRVIAFVPPAWVATKWWTADRLTLS